MTFGGDKPYSTIARCTAISPDSDSPTGWENFSSRDCWRKEHSQFLEPRKGFFCPVIKASVKIEVGEKLIN